jgi:YD repeat-containing protein
VRYAAYLYAQDGEALSVEDANNNMTTSAYDGFLRLSQLQFPLPTKGAAASNTTDYEAYTYDANGNRLSVRKRDGQLISYQYDLLNRQILKILPNTTTLDVWSNYDLAGRPISDYFGSASAASTLGIVYGYDHAKRLTSEAWTISPTVSYPMSYAYDSSSNRVQVTWPDGNYTNHDFDGLNREYQIRENGATSGVGVLAVYGYDALSRKTSLAFSNGTGSQYPSYDLASRLTQMNLAFSGQNLALQFGYIPPGQTNSASQLQSRSSTNGAFDWVPPTASNIAYTPDGLNRYASVGGASYTYDGRDNLQSDGTNTYTYDVENRLLTASGPTAVALSYDPLGRLQRTTAGSTVTQYIYSGTELMAELDGSGNVLRRYVHGPGTDDPVVWYEGATLATRNYLHADERGSVVTG